MRFHSGWGIVAFALTLTFSGVLWMKALQYQWFSAMYGVYFFSELRVGRAGDGLCHRRDLLRQRRPRAGAEDRIISISSACCCFAFTLFSAYTEFAQYFVVWNANMPEETFWYLIRERGNWWWLSMILIFGHFFMPFFVLLPEKVKRISKSSFPSACGSWLMHALDLAFNIFPALHFPAAIRSAWLWLPPGTPDVHGRVPGENISVQNSTPIRRIRSATRACSKRWA
jgi:hypothetical protein